MKDKTDKQNYIAKPKKEITERVLSGKEKEEIKSKYRDPSHIKNEEIYHEYLVKSILKNSRKYRNRNIRQKNAVKNTESGEA
jgi:hypothetical protein